MYDDYYGYIVKVIDLGILMIFITMRSGNSWQGFVLLTTVVHGYGMPLTSGGRCLMPGSSSFSQFLVLKFSELQRWDSVSFFFIILLACIVFILTVLCINI